MARRMKREKPIAYALIDPDSDIGRPMYERLHRLIAQHHVELDRTNARIALAWAKSWKADVDGRVTLGKCKKASDLDRELAPYDFVILLNRWFWLDSRVTDEQRQALLDHELMHAAVAYDDAGEIKRDERGRAVFRTRKHDLEEFSDIVDRHGVWKRDIEAFARALRRAESKTSGAWVGISSLCDTLHEIGIDVPKDVVATWPERERREVLAWALLRRDVGVKANVNLSQTMPECLSSVVRTETAAH